MATSGIGIMDLVRPIPPAEWDLSTCSRAKKIEARLSATMRIGTQISILCAGLSLKSAIAQVGFTAVWLTPTGISFVITAVALGALYLLVNRLKNEHLKGLTPEMLQKFVVEQLISGFEKLEVFSREDFEKELQTREKPLCDIGQLAVEEANQLKLISRPLYLPNLDWQPRFEIDSKDLSEEQILTLLACASKKGIILEFSEFARSPSKPSSVDEPGIDTKPKDLGLNLESMQKAFNISAKYLKTIREESNQSQLFDVSFINQQLNALGYKWDQGKVMKSPLFLESHEKLLIRPNCNEVEFSEEGAIAEFEDSFESIEIYHKPGQEYSNINQKVTSRTINGEGEEYSIWQEHPHRPPTFWEIIKAIGADTRRLTQVQTQKKKSVLN